MQKISKPTFLKFKKQIQELYKLGKKYDKEKDPEKKEALKEEIIQRCNDLKPKLNLADCSDEETQNIFGISFDSSTPETQEEEDALAIHEDDSDETNTDS